MNINYDTEAYGDIWAEIPEDTSVKTRKAFADKVYAEAEKIIKNKKDDFPHIDTFDTIEEDGYAGVKFSIFPDEDVKEDTVFDGAYFDSVFGNYLPKEKVIRTVSWDFDQAIAELRKLSYLLDKIFPEEGTGINETCFEYEADDLPEPPEEYGYDEEAC